MWKRNAELKSFCMLWKMVQRNDAGDGNVVVLHKKKKVLTTMLIMFLVSQLLIKATYFFYRFNYLVSDVLVLLACNEL